MKLDSWKQHILVCSKDENLLTLMANLLHEAEQAKQILRDKGYGWTGMSLLETAKIVDENK